MQRLLADDRSLDRRQALEHHLAVAKRVEKPCVLSRLGLGACTHVALVVDQAERSAAQGHHPAQPQHEVDLRGRELGLYARDDEDAAIALSRIRAQRRCGLVVELNRIPPARCDRAHLGQVKRVRLGARRDCQGVALDERGGVGVEHLDGAFNQADGRGALVVERADERQEVRQLTG